MIDKYVWSMDILEGSTLESKKEDHVDKHQSYILEEPQDPHFCEKFPDSIFPSTNCTYESYNHPMLLFYQILNCFFFFLFFLFFLSNEQVQQLFHLNLNLNKLTMLGSVYSHPGTPFYLSFSWSGFSASTCEFADLCQSA